MKKLALAFILVGITSFGYAQNESTYPPPPPPPPRTSYNAPQNNQRFRIGLQISPELSWLKSQDNLTSGSTVGVGFSYGLMFDYNFTRRYAFATGLYIAQAPATISYTGPVEFNSQKDANNNPILYPTGTSVNYNLKYIEIPISLKLKTNEVGYITYFGQFGFEGGINIKTTGDIKDPTPSTPTTTNHSVVNGDLGPDIGLFNVALLLGAGIEYSLTSSTSAYASLNFVNGFLDVTSNPSKYKSSATLNQLALRLGIFF